MQSDEERSQKEKERDRENKRKRKAEEKLKEAQERLRQIRPLQLIPDLGAAMRAASRSKLARLLELTADVESTVVRETARQKVADLEYEERFQKSQSEQAERELGKIEERLTVINRLIEESFAAAEREGCDTSRIHSCGI